MLCLLEFSFLRCFPRVPFPISVHSSFNPNIEFPISDEIGYFFLKTASLQSVSVIGFFQPWRIFFTWIVVWLLCLVFREYLWVCSWMDGKSLWGTNSASFHHKWATERNFNGTNMRAICLWKVKIKELWFSSTLDCNVWTRRDFFWVFATWLRERGSNPDGS